MPLRYGILILRVILVVLESIQRRATRFILKSDDEYLVSLRELCLLSFIKERRLIADVGFFYKMINNRERIRSHLTCLTSTT